MIGTNGWIAKDVATMNPRTTARLINAAAKLSEEERSLYDLQLRVLARLVLQPALIPELQDKLLGSLSWPASSMLQMIIALNETGSAWFLRDLCRAVVKEAQRGKKA